MCVCACNCENSVFKSYLLILFLNFFVILFFIHICLMSISFIETSVRLAIVNYVSCSVSLVRFRDVLPLPFSGLITVCCAGPFAKWNFRKEVTYFGKLNDISAEPAVVVVVVVLLRSGVWF